MALKVSHLDHFVIPCRDVEKTAAFYARVLDMTVERFGEGRVAVAFGEQKINLQPAGWDYEPKAKTHLAGTADFCLIIDTPLGEAKAHLDAQGVAVEMGPVERTGANGPILSLYFRDPDQNLIEISNYL
jgi:catechol 2,3-dioxygenase-like lactoylglutathione lyase family enzyme